MRKVDVKIKQIVASSSSLRWNRQFTYQGLVPGAQYIFTVQAYQLNGVTSESPAAIMYAWGPPQYLHPPVLTSSSTTQISLAWNPPDICRGWSIIEYALFMDDGNGGTLTEIDSNTVRGCSQILSHTVTTFPAS